MFWPNCITDAHFDLKDEPSNTFNLNICQFVQLASILFYSGMTVLALAHLLRFCLAASDKFKTNVYLLYLIFISYCLMRVAKICFISQVEGFVAILDLAPFLLAFCGLTTLLLTWSRLFSLITGKVKEQNKWMNWTLSGNAIVSCSIIVLSQVNSTICVFPLLLGSFAALYVFHCEGYLKWRQHSVPTDYARADSFPRITELTRLTTLALVLLAVVNSAKMMEDSDMIPSWIASLFIVLRWTSFVIEVAFIMAMLQTCYSLTFQSALAPPRKTKISAAWLTSMFREAGTIHHSNTVNPLKKDTEKRLTGGCHSSVSKMEISYSEKSDWAPKSIVVKLLSWDYSIWKRIHLAICRRLPAKYFETKEVSYLKSYDIESRFYHLVAPEIHGLKLPRIYFNYGDTFNNLFGMVMEDISQTNNPSESNTNNSITSAGTNQRAVDSDNQPNLTKIGNRITGQPFGFNFTESRLIVSQLATFHAWFWHHPDLDSYQLWDLGGYYTGGKRVEYKIQVEDKWHRVCEQFDTAFQLDEKIRSRFGSRLFHNRDELNSIYQHEHVHTLIHGDFKVSNLFITLPTQNQQEYNCNDLDNSTCQYNHSEGERNSNNKCNNSNNSSNNSKNNQYGNNNNSFNNNNTTTNLRRNSLDQKLEDSSVYAIDWQWVGKGNPAVDLSYYTATSIQQEAFNKSALKQLVKLYYSVLVEKGVNATAYPFQQMWRDFRLGFIDFVVYAICCKWSSMTIADFEENQRQVKDGLHIRSIPHARALIVTADLFMDSLGLP